MMKKRTCIRCQKTKEESLFVPDKRLKGGYTNRCKECDKLRHKKKRKDNKESVANYNYKRYGYKNEAGQPFTYQEAQTLYKNQRGKCAICGAELGSLDVRTTHIDHSHNTGIVRGILCPQCNHLLGNARDNVDTLKKAISYLGG